MNEHKHERFGDRYYRIAPENIVVVNDAKHLLSAGIWVVYNRGFRFFFSRACACVNTHIEREKGLGRMPWDIIIN